MKRSLVTGVALAALAGRAVAADLAIKAPPAPSPFDQGRL
jgi:hypothetical protein